MFVAFLLTLGLALSTLSQHCDWSLVGEGFMVFLADHLKSDGVPLMQQTMACYLTHAGSLLKSRLLIFSTELFLSRTGDMMKGIIKRDAILKGPRRLRMKASLTLPVILVIIQCAQRMYDQKLAEYIKWCILFGFFMGLRPGDFADLSKPQNGHRMLGYQVYFLFDLDSEPISICDKHLFPHNRPLFVLALPDNSKSAQCGEAPMRAVARNPSTDPNDLCFVQGFFDFMVKDENTPSRFQRVFGRCPIRGLREAVQACIKAAATVLNLPPHTMTLHGIRPAIAQHLADHSDADQDYAGGWNRKRKEIGGRLPYLRPALAWALRVTVALHDTKLKSPLARWIATAMAGPARAPITRRHEV